ncbi:MAG: T9SS type A sorting domain-containing protein [Chlorobi bacterium]|nr:T9SS type A sorting domain-containing protein [Chlorobiota bacterium]
MGKSPYLSDSVLMSAIEKENVLPNVLIKDILVANPQAAKSEQVMQKVGEKAYPLSDEMLAEVLLGKYIVAAKEKLEAQVNWYGHSRAMALNRLKQYYLSDTVNESSLDSLILLLENENGLHEKYELVFAYTKKGQWTDALDLLNGVPIQYSLNEQQQTIYNDLSDYMDIMNELQMADTNLFGIDETQLGELLYLAENATNQVGAYSKNILVQLGLYNYEEPILLPVEGLKSSNAIQITDPVLKSYPKIKLYPNPAKDYLIVELQTANLNGAIIELFNNQGTMLKLYSVPARTLDYLVNFKDITSGIYIISVKMNGAIIGSEKISIIR